MFDLFNGDEKLKKEILNEAYESMTIREKALSKYLDRVVGELQITLSKQVNELLKSLNEEIKKEKHDPIQERIAIALESIAISMNRPRG